MARLPIWSIPAVLVVALLVTLGVNRPVAGQDKAAPPTIKQHVDFQGDPLPKDALVRLPAMN
jgi:hypothetical protein